MTLRALTCAACLLLHALASAQPRFPGTVVPPRGAAEQEGRAPWSPGEEVTRRLEALRPENPAAYFELGEDVAADSTDPAGMDMARRLFVLAYHLDRTRGGQRTAAAACLALAELSPSARDRRWLWSMASSLDRRHARPEWVSRSQDQFSTEAGLRAANVLGMFRSGDGRAALELLKEPGVRALLSSYERALSYGADTGALKVLEREAERWPCPECHNQRIIKKPGSGKEPQYRLCGNCNGNPGPRLTGNELIAQLRLESALLRGIQRSWAAQSTADLGAPLRDPDPEELPRLMGIDTAKNIYRGGQWVTTQTAPAESGPQRPAEPPEPSSPAGPPR